MAAAALPDLPDLAAFRRFFLEEFESAAAEIEALDRIPAALLDRTAALGAYRLTPPAELGGHGLRAGDYLPYLEAAAMGPGAGRMLVHVNNGIWRPLAQFGSPAQRAVAADLAAGAACVAFAFTETAGGTGRDLHFPTGRALAEALGYPSDLLDRLPAEAVSSFAGVGYHFALARLQPGERVLDLGSGSGMDVFAAATHVGPSGRVIGVDITPEQLAKSERLRRADHFSFPVFRSRSGRWPPRSAAPAARQLTPAFIGSPTCRSSRSFPAGRKGCSRRVPKRSVSSPIAVLTR